MFNAMNSMKSNNTKPGKSRILVVDDDAMVLETIGSYFRKEPEFDLILKKSALDGLDVMKSQDLDLIISDLKMPVIDGIRFLQMVREVDQDLPFIILSGFQDISLVVDAMKKGAQDYLAKPIPRELLIHSIRKVLRETSMKEEIRRLKDQVAERYSFENMVGTSPVIQKIFDQIRVLSDTDATVLILGETGTGKELVARAIHQQSSRRDKAFIKINCAAISETLLESELFGHEKGAFTGAIKTKRGKFELGDKGTVSLDEIGDISMGMQSKLLRVLQEREFERVGGVETIRVDVRIIASTNANLTENMEKGSFRPDLFYRLNVFPIILPPLRDRLEDVPLLSEHFLKVYNQRFNREVRSISKEVLDILMNHNWPGNVRELENVLERAVIVCQGDTITAGDLELLTRNRSSKGIGKMSSGSPDRIDDLNIMEKGYSEALRELQENLEKKYLVAYLSRTRGSIAETAKLMELSPRSIYQKMKKYNIDKFQFRK